jgi:hypothetical protein
MFWILLALWDSNQMFFRHMLRKQQVWPNSEMLTDGPFPTLQREIFWGEIIEK